MADGELRNLRIQAHRALREIWTQGYMTKNSTYHWLSGKLALPEKETHVAMFSTYRCMETITWIHLQKQKGQRGPMGLNTSFYINSV